MKRANAALERRTRQFLAKLCRDLACCQIYATGQVVNNDSRHTTFDVRRVKEGLRIKVHFKAKHRLDWSRIMVTLNPNTLEPQNATVFAVESNGNPKEARGGVTVKPVNHQPLPGYFSRAA